MYSEGDARRGDLDEREAREIPAGESFSAFAGRLAAAIHDAQEHVRAVDKETALIMLLSGPVVRGLVGLARVLDHWNLFPRCMTASDAMFASIFLANLGSIGISDVYHHLFEYGTASLFGAVFAPTRMTFVEGDAVVVRAGLRVRWSFDERVHDGSYSARSLELVRRILEAPAQYLDTPNGDPAFDPPTNG